MEDDGDSVSLISDLETNEDIDTDMIAVAEDYNGDWKKVTNSSVFIYCNLFVEKC